MKGEKDLDDFIFQLDDSPIRYTKEEALQRYEAIRAGARRRLRAEEARSNVLERLSRTRAPVVLDRSAHAAPGPREERRDPEACLLEDSSLMDMLTAPGPSRASSPIKIRGAEPRDSSTQEGKGEGGSAERRKRRVVVDSSSDADPPSGHESSEAEKDQSDEEDLSASGSDVSLLDPAADDCKEASDGAEDSYVDNGGLLRDGEMVQRELQRRDVRLEFNIPPGLDKKLGEQREAFSFAPLHKPGRP